MKNWDIDKKIAASIVLALIGISYVAGVGKIFISVGPNSSDVKARYSAELKQSENTEDIDSFLEEPVGPISLEKLVHITHAHLMPYTFLFAISAFFIVSLSWSVGAKTVFLSLFAISILGDFAAMFLTRFLSSEFHVLIMLSGAIFGLCLATVIFSSFYELWIKSRK